jgi:hypothetical protein
LIQDQAWWAPEAFASKVETHFSKHRISLKDEGEAMLRGLVEVARQAAHRAPENPLHPFYLRPTDAEVNFPEASVHLSDALRKGQAR